MKNYPSTETILIEKEQNKILHDVLKTLSPREFEIIKLHFGFEGEEISYQEIGRKQNVSGTAIARIALRAFEKMRRHSRAKMVNPLFKDKQLTLTMIEREHRLQKEREHRLQKEKEYRLIELQAQNLRRANIIKLINSIPERPKFSTEELKKALLDSDCQVSRPERKT